MLHVALATGAALVGLAFAMSTYERWLARRQRHHLAWSAALLLFALAAGALAAGEGVGWSGPVFRVYFLLGAIVNVPFLALGTVYLLGGRRRGDQWAVVVVVFSAFAAGVLAVAPFTAPLPADTVPRGSEVFGVLPRVLAAVASGVGALVVFGGAAWSAWRIRRGRVMWGNVLIALGTLILANSGLLNSVLDEITGFVVTLLLGITVLFAGFLVATVAPTPSAAPAAAPSRPSRQAVTARS
ncbi:MAG TPA: hypothetical protein VM938_03510 [Acidimicrobiales bacterium]|nr:hypothetical protein [Acidimicrobiales bacterium]